MREIQVEEKRSKLALFGGLILICMGLASLITLRSPTALPEYIDLSTLGYRFQLNLGLIIRLLAYPSWFAANIWGEESMVMSVAFLLLGAGISLCFKKTITSKIRQR